MPIFYFDARTASGGRQTGEINASSRAAAAAQLHSRGLIVTRVEPAGDERSHRWGLDVLWAGRPSGIDVEATLQQLAILLRNGTTLLQAIEGLSTSSTSAASRRMWRDVSAHIQAGHNLSSALQRARGIPSFVPQLVAVGEKTGRLDPVLLRAAQVLRSRRQARTELLTAIFYPTLVVLLAVGVTLYMVGYLIPRLERYLRSLGKEIPAMTQTLVEGSLWLRTHSVAVLSVIGIVAAVAVSSYLSREGRFWIDRILLRAPVIGRIGRLRDTAQFSRNLALLIGSGVSLTESLATVAQLIGNQFVGTIVTSAREKILQGNNLSSAIENANAFTPMLKQMIAVGEQSGDLEGVLVETAEFHEELYRAQLRRLTAILTPLLTIGVGLVVGYVYIAFFMALFAAAG